MGVNFVRPPSISHISHGPRRRVESKNATISWRARPTEIKGRKVVSFYFPLLRECFDKFVFFFGELVDVPAGVLWVAHGGDGRSFFMVKSDVQVSHSFITGFQASVPRNYNWRYTDKSLFVLLVCKRKFKLHTRIKNPMKTPFRKRSKSVTRISTIFFR